MADDSLSQPAQDAFVMSRKIGKYVAAEFSILSFQDFRQFWDNMKTDKDLVASVVSVLAAKSLALTTYDGKTELTDMIMSIMTDKPITFDAEKSRGSVKYDMKRILEMKVTLQNTLYYILLNYSIDTSNFAIKKTCTAWINDMDKTRSSREIGIEQEICHLMSTNEKLDNEQWLKDLVYKCANIGVIRDDLQQIYGQTQLPTNKSMADSILFSFLLGASPSQKQSIISAASQLLVNRATMSDLQFYSLIFMLREFAYRDPNLDTKTLTSIYDGVKPFYEWPAPFCHTAIDFLQYIDFRKRLPGVASCLHFLQEHPDLLGKAKQEEHTFIMINESSFYGQSIKDLITSIKQTQTQHELKCQFLFLSIRTILEEGGEFFDLVALDQVIINQFFVKATEIVQKAPLITGNSAKTSTISKFRELKASIEDYVKSSGSKPPSVQLSNVSTPEFGSTSYTIIDLVEGEPTYSEKFLSGPGREEYPDIGATTTLEKIFSQFSSRTSKVTVKIVICGGDDTFSNFACGYSILKILKPDVFKSVDPMFYLIPVGFKNRFASCLSLMDPWYGRQVLLATKASMFLIPSINRLPSFPRKPEPNPPSKDLFERKDGPHPEFGQSPNILVKNMLDHYLRQGLNAVQVRLYLAEVLTLSPSGMITRRFIPFSQSVEIGSNAYSTISQKTSQDNPKLARRMSLVATRSPKFVPPEVTVKYSEIDIGGVAHPSPQIPAKAYWSIQVSNIPRSADCVNVVNPQSNCLELYMLDVEVGRKLKPKAAGGLEEGEIRYVNSVEIEDSAKRQFEATIDNEPINLVHKIKISIINEPVKVQGGEEAPQPVFMKVMNFTQSDI